MSQKVATGISGTLPTSPTNNDKYPVDGEQHNYPEVAVDTNQQSYPFYSQPKPDQSHSNYGYQQSPQGNHRYEHPPEQTQEKHDPAQQKGRRNPWGLSPLAFGLLVALITAVVVGGVVGGGVAGAMSGDNDKSSTPASSTSSTTTSTAGTDGSSTTSTTALPTVTNSLENYVVPEARFVKSLENPGCQQSRINVQNIDNYDLFCEKDFGNNVPDQSDASKVVADFVSLFAYSIEDCLYACTNANDFQSRWQTGMQKCRGVTWAFNMAENNATSGGNCFLKNGTAEGFSCSTCISAKLVT